MYWPKLVFIDYDLTLMDSLLDFYEAVNKAREFYGSKPYSFDEFFKLFVSDRISYEAVPEGVSERDFWRYFRRVYTTRHGRPMDGALYFLTVLYSINTLNIVVTGREIPSTIIWDELRRFGLDWAIDEVYTIYDISVLGGEEEILFDKSWILKHVLEKHGIDPLDAVSIGDYKTDVLSSAKVGVPFIGLSPYNERKKSLIENGACKVVSNLYEVLMAIYDIFYEGVSMCGK